MIYSCCTENRKAAVLASALNGIDFLEVTSTDQRTLAIHCLKPAPTGLTIDNILIQGGESITNIAVQSVSVSTTVPNVLVIETAIAGDFSPYRLRLVKSAATALQASFDITQVLTGFDLQMAEVQFSFKVECGPDFDCAPQSPACPPFLPVPPPINYLAKDYGSFRTVILDRLNQLLPGGAGSNEADLGVALAELLAYVGDRLSYQQDAVATEAYLQTARSRISLRRHALLVDYHVHDGANARAWIQLQVTGNPGDKVSLDPSLTRFSTRDGQVFEPMFGADLYPEHNLMSFYTWGETDCCLPSGAKEATLDGSFPNLQPGDVLIFEEMKGPQTGDAADADLRHRCAVRLTQVATLVDTLHNHPVTEIQWSQDDALPFPVCISSTYLDSKGDNQTASDVSVAFGNVVLADHGISLTGKDLGTVPAPRLFYPPNLSADRCQVVPPTPLPVRFRPRVLDSPLTQVVPLPDLTLASNVSASALMNFDASQAVPVITLTGALNQTSSAWTPAPDLLESGESDQRFVVEIDTDGTAILRFGDNVNGRTPDTGTGFAADYRIGNGSAGNVGADTVVVVSAADPHVQSCRNPLSASGGIDPETNDQIRRRAPQAFLTQERAVTMPDYEAVAETNPNVNQAVASLRWTGSWYTVFIAAEPKTGGTLNPTLQQGLKTTVENYRLAGQDLELDSPQYISLLISLSVCVDPNYFNADVQQSLFQALSALFRPGSFTFGQTVYLSPVYAAVRSVAGVTSVTATAFQPQSTDPISAAQFLSLGEIKMGRLQVARLENDPSFPDHGQLTLAMEGGK